VQRYAAARAGRHLRKRDFSWSVGHQGLVLGCAILAGNPVNIQRTALGTLLGGGRRWTSVNCGN
jgi:hypothetical protein